MEEDFSKRELNKIIKRETLINVAERLFIQNGFSNTSIDDVAEKSRVTKRTLYKYFTSKEDLFFAVVFRNLSLLMESFEEGMASGKNALEKIRLVNDAYLNFYLNHKDKFQLLSYHPDSKENVGNSFYFKEIQELDKKRINLYFDIISEAKLDKSIGGDLDIKKAVYFAFFSSFSILYTISVTSNSWEMLGFTESEFLNFSFDLITDSLE